MDKEKQMTAKEVADEVGGEVVSEPLPFEGEEAPESEVPPEKDLVRVESSKELAPAKFGIGIRGFEEVPADVIPTPWVSLVQPNSSTTILEDGSEAADGNFYIKDTQREIPQLEMVFLRVKRRVKEFRGKQKVQLVALGLHISDDFSPFLISFSSGSFSAVGRLMKKLKKLGAEGAWEYPVVVTTEKIVKEIFDEEKGEKEMVKYYEARFEVGERFDEEKLKALEAAYYTFGGALDRRDFGDEGSSRGPR